MGALYRSSKMADYAALIRPTDCNVNTDPPVENLKPAAGYLQSRQYRFHQLSLFENEVEERCDTGHTPEVRMRQQAPASGQFRYWAEHAYEIRFGIAQGRGEWPEA